MTIIIILLLLDCFHMKAAMALNMIVEINFVTNIIIINISVHNIVMKIPK